MAETSPGSLSDPFSATQRMIQTRQKEVPSGEELRIEMAAWALIDEKLHEAAHRTKQNMSDNNNQGIYTGG